MASHIRYIVKHGGEVYAGPNARSRLRVYSGLPIKTTAEATMAARAMGASLIIIREPRRVDSKRSYYQRICQVYRIGRKRPRKGAPKVAAYNPPVPGALAHAANHANGLAEQVAAIQQHYAEQFGLNGVANGIHG